MNKSSIFKDRSVVWSVVLLIVVILLLQYIKSTNPASAAISFFGTYTTNTNTSPTNNTIIPAPTNINTSPIMNSIIPAPTGTDETYSCIVCSKRTINGKVSGICNTSTSTSKCSNTGGCTKAGDACTVSGGSGGGSGGSDGGGNDGGGGGTKPGGGGTYPGRSEYCSYCGTDGNCITKLRDNSYCTDYCSNSQNECKKPISGTGDGWAPFIDTPDINIPAPQPQGFWARLWSSILSFFARW